MINWLNSLKKDFSGNILKFLDILEIDLNNFTKISVSGNSFRITTITTLKEVLNTKKLNAGTIIFSEDLDNSLNLLVFSISF